MNYTKIKTREQYNLYLERFLELFDVEDDCDEHDLLAVLLENYENESFKME